MKRWPNNALTVLPTYPINILNLLEGSQISQGRLVRCLAPHKPPTRMHSLWEGSRRSRGRDGVGRVLRLAPWTARMLPMQEQLAVAPTRKNPI